MAKSYKLHGETVSQAGEFQRSHYTALEPTREEPLPEALVLLEKQRIYSEFLSF